MELAIIAAKMGLSPSANGYLRREEFPKTHASGRWKGIAMTNRLEPVRNVMAMIGVGACAWALCSFVANYTTTQGNAQDAGVARPAAAGPAAGWRQPDRTSFHYVNFDGWWYVVYTGPGQLVTPPSQTAARPATPAAGAPAGYAPAAGPAPAATAPTTGVPLPRQSFGQRPPQ